MKSAETTEARPLSLHREIVQPGWVDYNNHLGDGYYMVIFSNATTTLMDHIGLDAASREATGCTLFTLEVHINYLHEVKGDALVRVDTQLLGHDQKRLHIFHTLYSGDSDEPAATNEQMLLNIDMNGPKSAPFRPEVLAKIEAIARAQADLPRPTNVGRVIALPKR
jgi:acyl-CoA thioester hydrolase